MLTLIILKTGTEMGTETFSGVAASTLILLLKEMPLFLDPKDTTILKSETLFFSFL